MPLDVCIAALESQLKAPLESPLKQLQGSQNLKTVIKKCSGSKAIHGMWNYEISHPDLFAPPGRSEYQAHVDIWTLYGQMIFTRTHTIHMSVNYFGPPATDPKDGSFPPLLSGTSDGGSGIEPVGALTGQFDWTMHYTQWNYNNAAPTSQDVFSPLLNFVLQMVSTRGGPANIPVLSVTGQYDSDTLPNENWGDPAGNPTDATHASTNFFDAGFSGRTSTSPSGVTVYFYLQFIPNTITQTWAFSNLIDVASEANAAITTFLNVLLNPGDTTGTHVIWNDGGTGVRNPLDLGTNYFNRNPASVDNSVSVGVTATDGPFAPGTNGIYAGWNLFSNYSSGIVLLTNVAMYRQVLKLTTPGIAYYFIGRFQSSFTQTTGSTKQRVTFISDGVIAQGQTIGVAQDAPTIVLPQSSPPFPLAKLNTSGPDVAVLCDFYFAIIGQTIAQWATANGFVVGDKLA